MAGDRAVVMSALLPGVATVHRREVWEDPRLPINDPPHYTPPRQDWSKITTGVAHYTGADNLIDGDPGEHAHNLPGYLRAIQADYRRRLGYSIGYLWAVDWLGGAWELRGWDYRAAANLGRLGQPPRTANHWTAPVLFLVDGQDPSTSHALATGRAIYREAGRRAGRRLIGPVPHSHLDPTGCPGDGIRAQITAGLLDPDHKEPPLMISLPLRQAVEQAARAPGGGNLGRAWDDVLRVYPALRNVGRLDDYRLVIEHIARNPGSGALSAAWSVLEGAV